MRKMEPEKEVKVNLPADRQGYERGNGEGCWAVIKGDAVMAYEGDELGNYTATLENDSVYYPGLGVGDVVPIEMRGEFRPVVPYEWLQERGWEN